MQYLVTCRQGRGPRITSHAEHFTAESPAEVVDKIVAEHRPDTDGSPWTVGSRVTTHRAGYVSFWSDNDPNFPPRSFIVRPAEHTHRAETYADFTENICTECGESGWTS